MARLGVPSPTGKATWNRETISEIIKNEKYIGNVILGKTEVVNGKQVKITEQGSQAVIKDHHPAIISQDLFYAAQQEKVRRSKKQLRYER